MKPLFKKKKKVIGKSNSDIELFVFDSYKKNGIIGIGNGEYSISVKFKDINYQIAREEDQENIFLQWCKIMNYFDSSTPIKITILNKRINIKDFEDSIEFNPKNDGLDEYRKEMNEIIKEQLLTSKNTTQKEMYFTISIKAKDIEEANEKFGKITMEISQNLKRIGSKCEVVPLKERLNIIYGFLNNNKEIDTDIEDIQKGGNNIAGLLTPAIDFEKNYFKVGKRYGRILSMKNLPKILSDKILTELQELNADLMLTLNVDPIEPDRALKVIQHKITGMEGNKIEYEKNSLKNGYLTPFIPYSLKVSLEEANELLDDVTKKDQKVFSTSLVIAHLADTKEKLDEDSETLKRIASRNVCKLGNLQFQQEEGLKCVLPLGINNLSIKRTLTTESTSVFMPFNVEELIQKDGMYYGKNATSNNLILFNRKSTKNSNGFILGTPGSGKSFAAKREIVSVLLGTNDDIIVIDPEREYTMLAKNLGGELIHISAGSKSSLNPLDLSEDYADEDNPMLLKSEFILSLCECLLGGTVGLSSVEKTIIDRCCNNVYKAYINSGYKKSETPTLKDFQTLLEKQPEKEAKNLALALELYTKGSLSIFANQTNVSTNKRFVVYDIKDLGKELKTMGMLIVLDNIWNKITENRAKGKRTWIHIDEIYLLFSNEYSAQYLFELYKRARKWGAIPTGITQNVEDLLKSDLARSMLSNSDFILMLNQATSDRMELAKLLNISETQLSYITGSGEGEGLLFNGNSIIPFIDKFPKDTELYKMMTTKVDEINKLEA